jgi:hypothetical protein
VSLRVGAFSRRCRRVCRHVYRRRLRSTLDGREFRDDCVRARCRRCPRWERYEDDCSRGRVVRGASSRPSLSPVTSTARLRCSASAQAEPQTRHGRRRAAHARFGAYRHRVAVVDGGCLDQLDDRPTRCLVVLRGPRYLGLRSIVHRELHPDGIVVLSETGRSLTLRDVEDVCGVPVVAQVRGSAHVARTIDAGLLVTRSHALRELAGLHQYVDTLVSATNPVAVSRRRHPSARPQQPSPTTLPSPSTVSPHLDPSTRNTRPKIGTDMPVALSATGRAVFVLSRSRGCTRYSLSKRHRRRASAEHREVECGSDRVLRR